MFATFNFQLTTVLPAESTPESPVLSGLAVDGVEFAPPGGFGELLQAGIAVPSEVGSQDGEFLPVGGNLLPSTESPSQPATQQLAIDAAEFIDSEGGDVLLPDIAVAWTAPADHQLLVAQSGSAEAAAALIAPTAASATLELLSRSNPAEQRESLGIAARLPTNAAASGPVLPFDNQSVSSRELPTLQNALLVRDTAATPAENESATPKPADVPVLPALRSIQAKVPRPIEAEPTLKFIGATEAATLVDRSPLPTATGQQPLTTAAAYPGAINTMPPQLANSQSGAVPDLIRTPVADPAWSNRIGERVVMLAGQQQQQAEIRLTPADLGPLRVRISIEEGAANVTFHAQHAVTRDAIESAMPRLREMLAENGLSLGQAEVGDNGATQGRGDDDGLASGDAGAEAELDAEQPETPDRQKTVTADGLIDTFA